MRQCVSLCLIVKNEAANLPPCLGPVIDLVHEIVLADTGSTDDTKEVARRFGARVFDFPWVDSFAAARNACLEQATGDWIFWLDADDRLDPANCRKLHALFGSLPAELACFTMRCQGTPDATTLTGMVVYQPRLFRRHPALRWQYRVHEQIWPSLAHIGGVNRSSDVVITHVGYHDPELRRRKRERNLRLLHLDHADHPDDPFILFNLGAIYQDHEQHDVAIPLLQRSLERAPPDVAYLPVLYRLLIRSHESLGQRAAALALSQAARRRFPHDAALLFQEAVLRGAEADPRGEEACLLEILRLSPAGSTCLYDPGLWAYQARHNLAVLCRDQGRFLEAERHWRAALAATPTFTQGWQGLAQLYLEQARWPDLEEVIQRLEAGLLSAEETTQLRAQAHLARREFTAARQLLDAVLPHYPRSLPLRRSYSQALLLEGRDWDAAERALSDVLALDPQQGTARTNLALLRQRRGQTARA